MAQQVLAIEDNLDTLALYRAMLGVEGYQVTTATNGKEGLTLFEKQHFDLVLLDLSMPEMSGIEALEEIRRIDPNVPVVVMTGLEMPTARERCEQLGVEAYVLKPHSIQDVVEIVRDTLKQLQPPMQLVTMRLPVNIIKQLSQFDRNLARAIIKLSENIRSSFPYRLVPVDERRSFLIVPDNNYWSEVRELQFVRLGANENLVVMEQESSIDKVINELRQLLLRIPLSESEERQMVRALVDLLEEFHNSPSTEVKRSPEDGLLIIYKKAAAAEAR